MGAEGGEVQWDPGACQACGITTGQGALEWRVCVCMAWYCEGCAGGPCVHCPARYIAEAPRRSLDAAEGTPTMERCDEGHGGIEHSRIAQSSRETVAPATPDEALDRRRALVEKRRQDLNNRRADGRRLVKRQIRAGTRPRREKKSTVRS